MRRIILLSDTHNTLDERFYKHFKNADEIWHAGDIGSFEITNKLNEFASVKAVWGNIDNSIIRKEFEKTLYFKCEYIKVLITHIGGYPGNYTKETSLLIKEKKPDLFISGHSHILKVIYDKKNKLLHMNPGAIGNVGIHKVKTILSFTIDKKEIKELKVIEFPRNRN